MCLSTRVRTDHGGPYQVSLYQPCLTFITMPWSVCKEKKVTPSEDHKVRVYKGSMKGGLKLDRKLKNKHKPIIGIVDYITDDASIDTNALKEEHIEEPQHFGIHLSKLETLDNERVQDREREIVDIF